MADASIYSMIRPVAPAADPLESYGKALSLKALMGQNELQGLQMQDTRETLGEKASVRDFWKGYTGKPEEAVPALMRVSPTAAMTLQKTLTENEKSRTGIDKDKAEIVAKATAAHRDALANVTDRDSAAQWVAAGYQDPVLGPIALRMAGPLEVALSRIPQDAAGLQDWIKKNALGATKFIEQNKPHITTQDLGGTSQIVATPGLGGTPQVVSTATKTATPGELLTDARTRSEGAANRGQADRHFQAGQNAPQYMETDAGIVALPKKPQAGTSPVGTLVSGPDGQTLGKPLKPLPPSVNDAIIGNAQSLYTLDKALKLIGGKNVDSAKGDADATGWKGYLPQSILNRIDASGVDTRAEIADIGSLKIHDRSGAAVTISESPRLMPFIPNATDPPDVATRKLTRLKEEALRMQKGLTETYSKEQGYKPNPILGKAAAPANDPLGLFPR